MKRILRTHHLDSLEGKCSCATEEKGTNVIVLWDEVPYTEALLIQREKQSSDTSYPAGFAKPQRIESKVAKFTWDLNPDLWRL